MHSVNDDVFRGLNTRFFDSGKLCRSSTIRINSPTQDLTVVYIVAYHTYDQSCVAIVEVNNTVFWVVLSPETTHDCTESVKIQHVLLFTKSATKVTAVAW